MEISVQCKKEFAELSKLYHIHLIRQTGLTGMFNVITLANCLRDAGHQVSITCIESGAETIPGLAQDIRVTGLAVGQATGWRKLICRLKGALRLRRLLRQQTFDLLYVLDSWTLPTLWLATVGNLRWSRAKLVYHTFDWLEPGLVAEVHRRLEKYICRKADLVVNTDRSRARMQQVFYQLRTRPLWVQNSLSAKVPVPPPNGSLRREMAGSEDTVGLRIVIYPTVVSNAESAQRMAWELIQAFRLLPEYYKLVLFYSEGAEYRRCLAAVAEAGLSRRIKFLEPMPFLRLLDYVASADLGAVFYDDTQSSGYFMCNADKLSMFAACGIPFVASDQPNIEAITYHYGLGLCCDPRNPVLLSEAFQAIGGNELGLSVWKQRARQAFLEYLNFEVYGQRLIAAIGQLNEKDKTR